MVCLLMIIVRAGGLKQFHLLRITIDFLLVGAEAIHPDISNGTAHSFASRSEYGMLPFRII